MIENLIAELKSTTKKKDKEEILKKYRSDFLDEVAVYTFDTMNMQYYVKKYNKCEVEGTETIEENWDGIKELLGNLSTRTLSGNAAIHAVEEARSLLKKESQEAFDYIIGRDWKAGVSKNSINKVWDNIVPDFSVALADTYKAEKHDKYGIDQGTWFISTKLDGCRCIAINTNGEWKFYSRAGNEFTTLDNVRQDLNKLPIKNVVLDGEICIVEENGIENFQAIMKEIKKKNHMIENPKYKLFDYLSLKDFYNKESKSILSDRLGNLKVDLNGIDLPTIDILPQIKFTEESFADLQKEADKNGWEGLMLRKDTTYQGKRSKDLLKVKKFYDAEYTVVGLDVGDMTFPVPGQGVEEYTCVRNVKIEHKGSIVSVGSGLSKAERIYYTDHQDELIGRTILVGFFEETTNQNGGYSLRFPTLKYIYEGKRDT